MTIHFEKLENDLASASAPTGEVHVFGRSGVYRNHFKRLFDVTLIIIAAPVVLLLVAILALIISKDGHSPIYRSVRVGKNGRNFSMLKLRTMVPGADELLERHLNSDNAANQEWALNQKLKDDPRITTFGRWLRKSSMDELPQLWNVLRGEMSLVGPRPMMESQRDIYPGLAYYSLRPGITGKWQVSDRNECEFGKRAEHDRKYDQELSFLADIQLLSRTVAVVLRGTGY